MKNQNKLNGTDQGDSSDKSKAERPQLTPADGGSPPAAPSTLERRSRYAPPPQTPVQRKLAHPASGVGIALRRVLEETDWNDQSEKNLREVPSFGRQVIRATRFHCPQLPPIPVRQSGASVEADLESLVQWSDDACCVPAELVPDWSEDAARANVDWDSMYEMIDKIAGAHTVNMICASWAAAKKSPAPKSEVATSHPRKNPSRITRDYVKRLLRDHCLVVGLRESVVDALVDVLVNNDVLVVRGGSYHLASNVKALEVYPSDAGRELRSALCNFVEVPDRLAILGDIIVGTGASGGGAVSHGRSGAGSSRRRVSHVAQISDEEQLARLEWKRDELVSAFGPRGGSAASELVDGILALKRSNVQSMKAGDTTTPSTFQSYGSNRPAEPSGPNIDSDSPSVKGIGSTRQRSPSSGGADHVDSPAVVRAAQLGPPGVFVDASPPALVSSAKMSVGELARFFGVRKEPLRKRLGRWRLQNPERGWNEVENRKRGECRYLFDVAAVRHVIDELRASTATSVNPSAMRPSTG